MYRNARLAVILLLLSCLPSWAGRRVALVVGNSNYQNGPLRNPGNDADAMAAALEQLKFDVTRIKDANLSQMKESVRDFRRSLSRGDAAFFYYSGHGVQVGGKNYLVPIGAKVEEEFEVSEECLSADRVLAAMNEAGSNLNVLVFDACRNNPFVRSWTRDVRTGLAQTELIPKGALIAFASAPGTVALDGTGKNSPYTAALLSAMTDRNQDTLELFEVFRTASKQVQDKTRAQQRPWVEADFGMDDFVLWANSGQRPDADQATNTDSSATSLPGDKDLDASVSQLVRALSRYLSLRQKTAISLGTFTGPPRFKATSGPGIDQVLRRYLARQQIKIDPKADVTVEGKYELIEGPAGRATVRVLAKLVDASGKLITDFSADGDGSGKVARLVDQTEDVVQLLGSTTELFVEDSDADRDNDLQQSLSRPDVFVEGSFVAASDDSPYLLQILVDGRPREVRSEDGLAFVDIDRGQTYSVRLINKSEFEAACELTIDGISVFAFSDMRNPADGSPRYQHYIIPPRSALKLQGWHKTNSSVDAFKVTSYAESAAALSSSNSPTGTITALFAAAWPKGTFPPHDEQLVGRGENATGFGPPQSQAATETRRIIGRLRAAVSVRYGK